jgi:HD-like signal output (HDOD) protein
VGEVNVDDLKEGMVLAADLKDSKGRFLLGIGNQLEKKHIRIMKIWGITAADVEGIDADDLAQESMNHIDSKLLEDISKYVDERFVNSVEDHTALKELKRLCIKRIAEKLSRPDGSYTLETLWEKETQIIGGGASDSPPDEYITPLHTLVDKNVQLSSFPDIYYQIMNVLNDTRSSATHLANVVSNDPGLSASLLKLVNSAYFGLPAKVDSITRAIALIGGRELSALAMGISVIRFFKGIPATVMDMRNFWLHSIACGIFSRILAHRSSELSEEIFFLGGLLHDIGRLIMFSEYPKMSAYTIDVAKKRKIPVVMVEREILGYDHSQVTGLLLQKWEFPKPLQTMIRFHHTPSISRKPLDSAIILTADIMAIAMGFGFGGNPCIPAFDKEIWDATNLSPSVLNLSIKQADRQISETLQAFRMEDE